MLDLHGCTGFSLVAVHGLLMVATSLIAEHGLEGSWASVVTVHGLRFPSGMWDLPTSGTESVSPVLAGRFFITEPPGKTYKGTFH